MSYSYIPVELRQLVVERANGKCEYCLIDQHETLIPHQPDHIIAEQHGGETIAENLALACIDCNRAKGPNIASIAAVSRQLTPLYHPRQDNWSDHFTLEGAYIRPLSSVGQVTAALLRFNDRRRVEIRELLLEDGRYP
jgi:hypothetical protein